MRSWSFLSALIFALPPLVLMTIADSRLADTRVALVIGNGAYRNVPRLANPANDAADVAAALKTVGFETILVTDLDRIGMDEAAIRFSRAARDADIALLYYSGHALQFGGVNYRLDRHAIDRRGGPATPGTPRRYRCRPATGQKLAHSRARCLPRQPVCQRVAGVARHQPGSSAPAGIGQAGQCARHDRRLRYSGRTDRGGW